MGVILFLVWILHCVIVSVQVDDGEYENLIPRIVISGLSLLIAAYVFS